MPNIVQNAFNAGELSPLLAARADIEKYAKGCAFMENCIPLPYGPFLRRGGTEYLGRIGNMQRKPRLVGFNYSTTTNFVLEFGEFYIRFWSNGQQVLDTTDPDNPIPLQVSTPYQENELFGLQFAQINDIVYVQHLLYPTYKLSRVSDTNWTFALVAWDWPPFLDENIESTQITASATTGNITLSADADVWNADHVGAYWEIGHRRTSSNVDRQLAGSDGLSPVLEVLGDWEFTTYGNWQGTVSIERSYDGTIWDTIRDWTNTFAGQRNVSDTGQEEKQAKLRIKWVSTGGGTSNPLAVLEVSDNAIYGFVKITAFTDARHVSATVVQDLYAITATTLWSEGAWSTYQGYPRTVALYESRIVYGGTKRKPVTIWGSIVDDFENFRYSTNEDGAFQFSLVASQSDPINWMLAQQTLLVGTAGDEWTLGPSDTQQVLGPTNVQAKRQSSFGSQYLQARIVNEVILFTQRQGRKVRELVFAFEKDGWVAPDLTILSEHITKGGILDTAFQQQPHSIFWCVRGDGQLIGMTYEREQQVVAWHRHITDGFVESVATIYGGAEPDEVWVAVRREVGGQTVRCMERIKPDFIRQWEDENKAGWWYLDCAVRRTGTESLVEYDTLQLPVTVWTRLQTHEAISLTIPNNTGSILDVRKNGVDEDSIAIGSASTFTGILNTDIFEVRRNTPDEDALTTLAGVTISVRYSNTEGPCAGGHSCDCAIFDLTANGVFLGRANLNNADDSGDRSFLHIITEQESASIGTGQIQFALSCNQDAPGFDKEYSDANFGGGCHAPIGWVQIFDAEGNAIYDPDACPSGDFFSVDITVSSDSITYSYIANDGQYVTGLEHLEGKNVGIWADEANQPEKVVTNGRIQLEYPATNILVGLPFVSTIRSMNLEIQMQDGGSQGRKSKTAKVGVNLKGTLGAEFRRDDADWRPLVARQMTDNMNESPPVQDGYFSVYAGPGWAKGDGVWVRTVLPTPLCVLSFNARTDWSDLT